jgi:Ca2+-binding EF-hand superfamily protein
MKRLRKRKISFSEFLTYCTNRFFLIRESNIRKVFEIFDEDGSGEIEISELRDTLGNSKEIREEVWLQLLQEVDSNSDGKISYSEFNDMIRAFNYADRQSRHILGNPFDQA